MKIRSESMAYETLLLSMEVKGISMSSHVFFRDSYFR